MARKKPTQEKSPHYQKTNSKPDKVFYLEFLTPAQKLAWTIFQEHDVMFMTGSAGTGKAQPLTAKVCVPKGWMEMGDLLVGDEVCIPSGGTAKITALFPQGKKDVYKVSFNDGSYTECCLEHLWRVSGLNNQVVNTKFLIENLDKEKKNLWFETITSVAFNERQLPVDPYLVGEIISSEKSMCLAGAVNEKISVIKESLTLDNKNKVIPDIYLKSSTEQRLSLLHGLMDSKGIVDKRSGQLKYVTTSSKLADSISSLIDSLGGSSAILIKEKPFKKTNTSNRITYVVNISLPHSVKPFGIENKNKLWKPRKIKRCLESIVFIGQKECQCILIDHPDHLYITDNYIVTHNTHLAVGFALQELFAGTKKNIIISRPIVEAGENLGFLPGSLEEKVDPYMLPLYDCLTKMTGNSGPQRQFVQERLEVAPLAYLRGRSFIDSVCILDEAQNCSMAQLILFLTRLSDGSKMIITGDPYQSDLFNQKKTPLAEIVEMLSVVEGIGVIEFPDKYIVRHPLVGKILTRLKKDK